MSSTLDRPPETAAPPRRSGPPPIPGPLDVARGAWKRLRRMSTALGLLLSMAAASIVATFVPQAPVARPETIAAWRSGTEGPGQAVARGLDALGLFDVFGSWWFMALLVLLFTSLTACLLPRYRAFARAARRPPAAGRSLERLSHRSVLLTTASVPDALVVAERLLRRRRFRRRHLDADASPTATPQLAAERGHWREGGSLVFHTAFYVLLVGIVVGQLGGFTGFVSVVEGGAFVTDAPVTYDSATPGRLYDPFARPGFTVRLDDFADTYHDDAARTPADYVSTITITDADGATRTDRVRVNEPVSHGGLKLYQTDFGMAPQVVLRDARTGEELFRQAITLTAGGPGGSWLGRTKVWAGGEFTDESGETRPVPQMGLDVLLYPDAGLAADGRTPVSVSPETANPVFVADLYLGELGFDQAVAPTELTWDPRQRADGVALAQGETAELLDGLFTLTFEGVDRWSGLQVSHAPGRGLLLTAAALVLIGLVPSLYAYRRRLWVTARPVDGGTEVVLAGVALHRGPAFDDEFSALSADLRAALEPPPRSA